MGTQERPSHGVWQFTNCIDYVAYIGFMSATCSQVCPVWGYSQEMLGPIGFDKHPNNCGPTVPTHGLLCKVAFSLLASLDIARRTHWSNIWRVMFIWLGSLCRHDMSDLWKWQVYSNLEFKFVYRELVVLCLSLFFLNLDLSFIQMDLDSWPRNTETGFAALKFMYGWAWRCFSLS